MIEMWQDFSLLRPWVLLGALPLAITVWALHKRADPSQRFQGLIAPHLLPYLITQPEHKNRLRPSHLLLPTGLVMPLTHDTGIIEKMAQALAPSVMPAHGDALEDATALAHREVQPAPVATAGTGGDRRQDEGYLLLPFFDPGPLC